MKGNQNTGKNSKNEKNRNREREMIIIEDDQKRFNISSMWYPKKKNKDYTTG